MKYDREFLHRFFTMYYDETLTGNELCEAQPPVLNAGVIRSLMHGLGGAGPVERYLEELVADNSARILGDIENMPWYEAAVEVLDYPPNLEK